MDSQVMLSKAVGNMRIISRRLAGLLNLTDTIYLGLKQENTEEQVLDCMESISGIIKELLNFMEETLSEAVDNY